MNFIAAIVGIVCAALWLPSSAAELTAADIAARAYKLDGGKDGVQRLTFTFQRPNAPAKKQVYIMVWKDYRGTEDLDSKLIFFTEFPPEDRGKSFMAWLYTDKMDDHWLYLPELRMVRKISHGAHQHHHDDDDFGRSDLTRADLAPRDPEADVHRLLRVEELAGGRCYVIESIPKTRDERFPYSKTVRWITQDAFLPVHIDYYGTDGELQKRQDIDWQTINGARVWHKVVGVDAKRGSRTVLEVSDVRVNVGVKDSLFAARTLQLGVDSLN